MTEYALRYDGEPLVRDPSWRCVADVMATFAAAFTDEARRVTGVLLKREKSDDEWEEVP